MPKRGITSLLLYVVGGGSRGSDNGAAGDVAGVCNVLMYWYGGSAVAEGRHGLIDLALWAA